MKIRNCKEHKISTVKDPVRNKKQILQTAYKLNNKQKKQFNELDYINIFNSFNCRSYITSIYPYGKDFVISIRDELGRKHVTTVKDFYPYFFAKESARSNFIEDINGKLLVTYKHPGMTKKLRLSFQNTFEADILYDIRFMIDVGYIGTKEGWLDPGMPYNKWYADIEVYSESGTTSFDPLADDNMINTINIFNTNDFTLYTIIVKNKNMKVESDIETRDIIIANDNIKNIIMYCESEKELLLKLFDLYTITQPDFIMYWNAPYDTSFIYQKTMKYLSEIHDEIAINGVDIDDENNDLFFIDEDYFTGNTIYHTLGSTTLDLLRLYKSSITKTREEYTLDYITLIDLGEDVGGKVKYEGTLDELYINDIDRFLEYSIKDAYLLYLIDMKHVLTEKFIQLSGITLLPIRYFNKEYSTKLADCIYSQYLMDDNKCMVTKRQMDKVKYTGALVHLPTAGIYNWFCDLDASSMYPSIIISCNISVDTMIFYFKDVYEEVIENKERKIQVDLALVDKIREYLIEDIENDIVDREFTIVNIYNNEKKLKLVDIKDMLIDKYGKDFTITPAGVVFSLKQVGILPKIMKDLLIKRKKYKSALKISGKLLSQ